MRWFRFYDEVLDDPKAQRLPSGLFKAWVNILCLASRGGGTLGTTADIAFGLRVTAQKAEQCVSALVTAGLLDRSGETLHPHNWNGRQFQSDDSGNRVREFRKRHGNAGRNCNVTADVTPPEQSRTETDTEQKEVSKIVNGVSRSLRAQKPRVDYSDPAQRTARWMQKMTDYVNRTLPAEQAYKLIMARINEEPWAVTEFNRLDKERKAKEART